MKPFGFGRMTGIDLRRRGDAACCRPPTGSATPTTSKPEQQKWYAGETISLGIGQGYNNFTMLQLAQRHRHAGLRRPALQAAPGARDRGRRAPATQRRVAGEALPPLPLKPEHVELIRRAHARRDAGRHLARARSRGAPLQDRRQDRHRAGRSASSQNEKYNACQARRAPARPLAVHRLRAARRAARSRWRVVVENAGFGADAAAPIARRVFDYLLPASTRARKTSPRRGTASRPRRSARRAGGRRCRCPGATRRRRRPAALVPQRRRPAPAASAAGRAAVARVAPRSADERRLRAAVAVAARQAGVHRLRRPAAAGDAAAGRRRPGDDVLGRLRPRHALRRPRPQHAARARRSCSSSRRCRRRR